MLDEKPFIEACIRSERSAQYRFYEKYSPKLYAVAIRYMKDIDDAKEVLQVAFIKIFENLRSFRFDGPVEAWMRRIVVNTAIRHLQNRKEMTGLESVEYGKSEQSTNQGLENLNLQQLNELIESLPTGCRLVFNMFAVDGYKHQEIAEILNITEGTSKSQFARARSLLIDKIEKLNERII